ncbi:MAG: hypothetical protein RR986_06240 [Longicatena sp.]
MFNLFKSELYRISKLKSFWILTVVLLALGQIAPNMSASVNETRLSTGTGTTAAQGFLDSLGSPMFYLIILVIFITYYICAGFEQRTVQDSIAAGGGRGKILVSKALGVYSVAFVMMLVYSLSYTIAIMYTKGGGLGFQGDVIIRMILAFFTIFIQNISQATLIILVAFALKKVGTVMAIGVCTFSVGILTLNFATTEYTWLAQIVKFSPFAGGGSVTAGFSAPYVDYFMIILIGLVWIVGFLAVTHLNFHKAELR